MARKATSKVMSRPANRSLTRYYRPILVALLLAGAILRIHGLNNVSPPGLEHDEVAHWIINRGILEGNHGVYFAEAYGHEAAFHYVQTGFMVLLGENAFVLRLPSAFAGLLLVAVTFALVRRLFGKRNALLAAGLLAVLFWPVFYSRLALRAIALPLVSGLSAYFWWRGWLSMPGDATRESAAQAQKRASLIWFATAGLLAGLALYTYMASRALPIFYGLFAVYLLIIHRKALKQRKSGVGLFFGIFALVAAPLLIYLVRNSGVETRIGEVDAPLRALAQGDLGPVLENTLKFLAMFAWRGDPLWRQNVANLPVFDAVVGLLFTIGLAISLWRWRQAGYMFAILWLFTSAIPSIVTVDAPSSIRIINALPLLAVFPAIGLEVIHLFRPLSTVSSQLSPVFKRNIAIACLLMVFIWHIGRTWHAVFDTWPANEEVKFVWQQALTDAARYLDNSAQDGSVAIGGWTPGTMDPPTMELTLRREDLSLRYFDPRRAVIVPPGGRIIYPTALPLHPALAQTLAAQGLQPQPMGSFLELDVGNAFTAMSEAPPLETFGDEVSLIDYQVISGADTQEVVLILRVEQSPSSARRVFFHVVDGSDEIVAQDDALGAPATYWQEGDFIIQYHDLGSPAGSDDLLVRLGVYDPTTGVRLLTASGMDSLTLPLAG
jgi:4-amino-4-deoxy-L-arabinose transferase-like glycosyltransferase